MVIQPGAPTDARLKGYPDGRWPSIPGAKKQAKDKSQQV
jgi:hypothetical protein